MIKLIMRNTPVIFILTKMHKVWLKFLQLTCLMIRGKLHGEWSMSLFYSKEGEFIFNKSAVYIFPLKKRREGKAEKELCKLNLKMNFLRLTFPLSGHCFLPQSSRIVQSPLKISSAFSPTRSFRRSFKMAEE